MPNKQPDFGGYATKYNIRCADGRTIGNDAFAHQDGERVPLVWQHGRTDPENILGYGILEHRKDGVYVKGYFNNSEKASFAKEAVQHGDITHLSIYANHLSETSSKAVTNGMIREVSLVVAGANRGALIDNVSIEHSDGEYETLFDEAVIYSGVSLEHGDKIQNESEKEEEIDHAEDKTIQEILDGMSEEQKTAVYALVGMALEEGDTDEDDAEQSDEEDDNDVEHSNNDEGGQKDMMHNVFEGKDNDTKSLSHDDIVEVFTNAKKYGSLRDALKEVALEHGIDNIDILFPEAKAVNLTPEMIMRDQEWVAKVWNAIRKSPFSRIKSTAADLTKDEARAKGYIKGKKKEDEQFALLKRITTPQTVYKKQALDRDDVIDITDFDVVAWLKAEMRLMLNEELARAVLVGDGRVAGAEDKINETNIRPVWTDDDLYAIHYPVALTAEMTDDDKADAIVTGANKSRKNYKGSGSPTLYTDSEHLTTMLLAKDKIGRRLYNTPTELASALRVKEIVEVPVMEGLTRTDSTGKEHELIGIIVNPTDYVVGADRGGAVSMFDDFDIDYNRQKYLIETRCSGALVKPYSAIVLESPVNPQ